MVGSLGQPSKPAAEGKKGLEPGEARGGQPVETVTFVMAHGYFFFSVRSEQIEAQKEETPNSPLSKFGNNKITRRSFNYSD